MEKFKVAKLTYQMTRSMSDHSLQKHADAARKRRETIQNAESHEFLEIKREESENENESLRHRRTNEESNSLLGKVTVNKPKNSLGHLMTGSDGLSFNF